MTLTATLVLASAVTLAVAAVILGYCWRRDPAAWRSWIKVLARAIVAISLHYLPPAHRARYREECAADLADQADPWRMLRHAFGTAACAPGLMRTLGVARRRRPDSPARRALAHLGVPVRLAEPPESADASYVFGGAMRSRGPDSVAPAPNGE